MLNSILNFKDKMIINSHRFEAAPVIPTDYIAFYKFDGNGDDETGSYGSISTSNTEYVTGYEGLAIGYLTTAGTMRLPDSLRTELTGVFTISSWIRSNFDTSTRSQIFGGRIAGSGQYGVAIAIESTGEMIINVFDSSSVLYEAKTTGRTLEQDVWHHYAYQYDGTYLRIFEDGILRDEVNIGSIAIGWGVQIGFGALNSRPTWDHNLDLFRIYDRALTQEEITALKDE